MNVETDCPYCSSQLSTPWATENNFVTVRCNDCSFLYVNPRPDQNSRDKATELGVHGSADNMDISERYLPSKTVQYRLILSEMFSDVWKLASPISWLDIGAGYGEVMDAVALLAPKGSRVLGLEPMRVKAEAATQRGLTIHQTFINPNTPKVQYASLINVFSHVYDFDALLKDIHSVLLPGGELLIETGDMTGLAHRDDFPGELGLPDHIAFASLSHMQGYLTRNGFVILKTRRDRIDGYLFFAKNVVKKIIGRNVRLKLPNSSPYHTLFIRAKKVTKEPK